jgi:hypothetical protein
LRGAAVGNRLRAQELVVGAARALGDDRRIRADPTMLILVICAFSISVNPVATGTVTEATNLSVGIVDEDGSDLSRRIAEGLRLPDIPARCADKGLETPQRPSLFPTWSVGFGMR